MPSNDFAVFLVAFQIQIYKDIKICLLVIADFPEGFNFTKVKDEENLYQIENNGILSQGNILNCTCCALNAEPLKPFVNYKN